MTHGLSLQEPTTRHWKPDTFVVWAPSPSSYGTPWLPHTITPPFNSQYPAPRRLHTSLSHFHEPTFICSITRLRRHNQAREIHVSATEVRILNENRSSPSMQRLGLSGMISTPAGGTMRNCRSDVLTAGLEDTRKGRGIRENRIED